MRTIPKKQELSQDRARRAVSEFRKLQPTLTAYARNLTKRSNVRVEMHSETNGRTDGTKIYYRPPLALGDASNVRHDRTRCDKRDPFTLQQTCPACRTRENILATIYHEIGHIAFESMITVTDTDVDSALKMIQQIAPEWYYQRIEAQFPKWRGRMIGKIGYKELANQVNPAFGALWNALEDCRINQKGYDARPGTQIMREAMVRRTANQGIPYDEGGVEKFVHWNEADANRQAIIGCLLVADGYPDIAEAHLDPGVVTVLRDAELGAMLAEAKHTATAQGIFTLSFQVFLRLRDFGFFFMEDEEPPPIPSDEESDDSSSDADDSETDSDSDRESGTGESDDDSDGPDDEASSDSGTGDGGESGDSERGSDSGSESGGSDSDSDGEESDGSVSDSEPGDEQSESDQASEADDSGRDQASGAGENQDSEGDSSGADGEGDSQPSQGDAGTDSEMGDSAGSGLGEDSSDRSDDVDNNSDSRMDDGNQSTGGSLDRSGNDNDSRDDSDESDSNPEELGSEAGDDSESDTQSDSRSSEAGTAERGSGGSDDAEQSDGSDDVSGGSDSSDNGLDGQDDGAYDDGFDELDESDTVDSGGDQSSGASDGSEPGDGSDRQDADSGSDSDSDLHGPSDSDADGGSEERSADGTEPGGSEVGSEADGGLSDRGTDRERSEGPGSTDGEEEDVEALDYKPEAESAIDATDREQPQGIEPPPMSADEKLDLIDLGLHPEVDTADDESDAMSKALESAIIQSIYFEQPSANVVGLNVWKYDERFTDSESRVYHAWEGAQFEGRYKQQYKADTEPVGEDVLGPALMRMRIVFSDNRRTKHNRNQRSGRIDPRTLGRRAWSGDDRLFGKRVIPNKKDYFVAIFLDCSGSTRGVNLKLIKEAALAQAELCFRMGINFAVYAHTGSPKNNDAWSSYPDGMWVDLYEIKAPEQAWDDKAREALQDLGPSAANLDGHTLEFARKLCDTRQETNKVILYYSDGAFPLENHDEELDILHRELALIKARRYTMLGVGIRTDSPKRHGMDTVQINESSEVGKVVSHLERVLIS